MASAIVRPCDGNSFGDYLLQLPPVLRNFLNLFSLPNNSCVINTTSKWASAFVILGLAFEVIHLLSVDEVRCQLFHHVMRSYCIILVLLHVLIRWRNL